MNFKKYNEIENSYNSKSIMKHLEYNPDLTNMVFIAREKIDGSNLQLVFEPFKKMKVAKRSGYLEEDENFFDHKTVLDKYKEDLNQIQFYCNQSGHNLRLYGELFGPGIQKRVDYGTEKQIRIFDLYINDILCSQDKLENVWWALETTDLQLVPVVARAKGLDAALAINEVFDSKILNKPGNTAEGIVITPYEEVVRMPNGERFILKKKSEAFAEKMKQKIQKPKQEMSPEVLKFYTTFREYINENRVLSCFSKHGNIQNEKQLGDYIRLIREDAIKDFQKDYSDVILNDDDSKIIFNVGKEVVPLLRKYL